MKEEINEKFGQELIVSDEFGYLFFINIHSLNPVQEYKIFNGKIIKIEIIEELSQLLVVTKCGVLVLLIKRGGQIGVGLEGHIGKTLVFLI